MKVDGFREFEFDLPDALLRQLITVLDGMEMATLSDDRVGKLPNAQGVYQLFLEGDLVYIGKTDAEAGLQHRLERHARVIKSRKNLDADKVAFKAVQVLVFSSMDLETALIKEYKSNRKSPIWNNSGFGANDPGRRRDETKVKATSFDALYPIEIDKEIHVDLSGCENASDVLKSLKNYLPFVLRYQNSGGKNHKPHPELVEASVDLPVLPVSTRSLITTVVNKLPKGWQATELPGYVILYRENKNYEHGKVLARS